MKIASALRRPGPQDRAYLEMVGELRSLILRGTLGVDERLPTETELGELFGVGRSTVREAIRVLASEGLIEIVRGAGGGTFVRLPKIQDVADRLSRSFTLIAGTQEAGLDEFVEARRILEVQAARAAARSGSAEQIAAIHEAIPAVGAERVSAERIYESNYAFHVALLEASGNRVIRALAEPIFAALHARGRRDPAEVDIWEQVSAEHREIAAAVASHDADRAAALMDGHIDCSRPLYADGPDRR